jgi:hypothetical protein
MVAPCGPTWYRLRWKNGHRSSHSVQLSHFHKDPRSFLVDLRLAARPRRHVPPCSPAVAFLGATRSPRRTFWEAPNDGRQSKTRNRRADAVRVTQINSHHLRRLEDLPRGPAGQTRHTGSADESTGPRKVKRAICNWKSVIDPLADAGRRAALDIVTVANRQLMIGRTRRHRPCVTV